MRKVAAFPAVFAEFGENKGRKRKKQYNFLLKPCNIYGKEYIRRSDAILIYDEPMPLARKESYYVNIYYKYIRIVRVVFRSDRLPLAKKTCPLSFAITRQHHLLAM